MTTTEIPIAISPAVTEYVAELGLQTQFQEILDKVPEYYPNPSRIKCEFDPGVPDEEDPVVIIMPTIPDRGSTDPPPHMKWLEWVATKFSGRDYRHFVVLESYEANGHARP